MAPPKLQIAIDLVAIICLVALIVVMTRVILTLPIISPDTPSYVVAGVTVAATIFTGI